MTIYRALDNIPSKTELPQKPPSVTIALHLIIENFNKHGRGRKPACERIEAMLERDYAMVKAGNCDYRLTVAYDHDPDGSDLNNESSTFIPKCPISPRAIVAQSRPTSTKSAERSEAGR
nr:hypothetical protein [Rhizobium sp. ACO-34A]